MFAKKILLIGLTGLMLQACSNNGAFEPGLDEGQEHEHEHGAVFTPEEEAEWSASAKSLAFRFAQTKWKECRDDITGNYTGFGCTNRRNISVILRDYLLRNVEDCAEEALRKIGINSTVRDTHIVHVGIQGDRNHSPRSLHAESRAVDIKSIELSLRNGGSRKFTFQSSSSDSFYRPFRQCWGRKVNQQNGCPLISGNPERTGSIGKEDRNHRKHMHLSIPYCVRGQYSSLYFRR